MFCPDAAAYAVLYVGAGDVAVGVFHVFDVAGGVVEVGLVGVNEVPAAAAEVVAFVFEG